MNPPGYRQPMLVLLLACATQTSPNAPEPAVTAADLGTSHLQSWTLTGRAIPGQMLLPAFPDGAALLGDDCSVANRALHGDGPPCLAERWEGPDGVRVFLRSGKAARWSPGGHARTRWPTAGTTLAVCLGDLLLTPPAFDPGGTRGYDGQDWVIAYTGHNPCAISGTLRLRANADRTDWSGLLAEGHPWEDGGKERANARAAELVRLNTP